MGKLDDSGTALPAVIPGAVTAQESTPSEWTMHAEIAMAKWATSSSSTAAADDSAAEDSLRVSLTVNRLANAAGQWEQLGAASILQTYVQIVNPEKQSESGSSGTYYDNYTSTIKFAPADAGEVAAEKYLDQIDGKGASCGPKLLGEIITGDHSKTTGDSVEKCGFYKPDLEAMSIVNLEAEGVSFTTVFSRRFKEFGLQELKRGMSLTMRTGFNVFDSINAQARSAGGSG